MSALALLGALRHAPKIFKQGKEFFEQITGKQSTANNEDELVAEIESLPPSMKAEVISQVMASKARMQELDTDRFIDMNKGGADKIKASARPEAAMRAMAVLELMPNIFKWLIVVALVQWGVEVLAVLLAEEGATPVKIPSVFAYLNQFETFIQPFLGVVFAAIMASRSVILKYMGCRERDKAQEFEMQHGKPLSSSQATVASAAGGIAGLVSAWRKN